MEKTDQHPQNDEVVMRLPKDIPSLSPEQLRAKVIEYIEIEDLLIHEYMRRINEILKSNQITHYSVNELYMENYDPDDLDLEFNLIPDEIAMRSKEIQQETLARLREVFDGEFFEFDDERKDGGISCAIDGIETFFK